MMSDVGTGCGFLGAICLHWGLRFKPPQRSWYHNPIDCGRRVKEGGAEAHIAHRVSSCSCLHNVTCCSHTASATIGRSVRSVIGSRPAVMGGIERISS